MPSFYLLATENNDISLSLSFFNTGYYYNSEDSTFKIGSSFGVGSIAIGYNQVFKNPSTFSEFGIVVDPLHVVHIGFDIVFSSVPEFNINVSAVAPFKKQLLKFAGFGEVFIKNSELNFKTGILLNPFKGIFLSAGLYDTTKVYYGVGMVLYKNFAFSYQYMDEHKFSLVYSIPFYEPLLKSKAKKSYIQIKKYKEKRGVSLFSLKKNSFSDLLFSIEKANSITKKIYVDLDYEELSFAQAEEIRNLLQELKNKKVKVYTYASFYDLKRLFISSVADTVIIHPSGRVYMMTPYATLYFFKGFLEKIGMEIDYSKIGKYKSAVESFTQDSASVYNKTQIKEYLNCIRNTLIEGIAEDRGIIKDKIEETIDKDYILTPDQALKYGFVDISSFLPEKGIVNYSKLAEDNFLSFPKTEKGIALVVIEGSIVEGKSSGGFLPFTTPTTGSRSFKKLMKKLKKNKKIKGIIIRINSPGGSAFASDDMWLVVKEVATKKPIYVSFSSTAGSGGYYVASTADTIFSNKMSLTGSIGIFGMKFVYNKTLKKLGINTDVVKLDEHSDMFSPLRKMNREEYDLFARDIRYGYRQFLERVADGRNMNIAEVDSIGEGRIWSGKDAVDKNLVDINGGILDAIRLLKKRCNLKEDAPVYYFSDIGIFSLNTDLITMLLEENILFILPYIMEIK